MRYLSIFILMSQQSFALSIHQIVISRISDEAINVELETEGEELYYFSSWHYAVYGNMITIEACFVQGFGSTIEYLNNNFEIPMNTFEAQVFRLRVKVFYDSFQEENLQDSRDGFFTIPIQNDVVLSSKSSSVMDKNDIRFSNPSDGTLLLNHKVESARIYDENGRFIDFLPDDIKVIDISNLSNGCYFLCLFSKENHKTLRIILRKN